MNCPLCVDQMLQPHSRAGIEIDCCPHCHGIWLDRGELERLAAETSVFTASQSVGSEDPPADTSTASDGRSHGSSKKKSKKKRFADRLGDVFEDVLDI